MGDSAFQAGVRAFLVDHAYASADWHDLLGAIVGVTLIATSRGGRKTAIPFGPFMIAAALTTVFAGGWLADGYLGLLGAG